MPYQFGISDCDVRDKERLAKFREERKRWIYLLRHDEHHSVFGQIYKMCWNDAVFRLINESRWIAAKSGGDFAANNGMIAEFIDQGYVATQALAIRRLTEKRQTKPDRQPISIRRVLSEIRDNHALITRECYVSYDGLPYEYEDIRAKWIEHIQKSGEQYSRLDSDGPKAWATAERVHRHFDLLSGVSPESRSRNDLIAETVFIQISNEIARAEIAEVSAFADKFLAHAADDVSRRSMSDRELKNTMAKFTECHKALFNAAEMICASLLWEGSTSPLPQPQFGFLKNLDRPWIPDDGVAELQKSWDQHMQETDDWAAPQLSANT